MQSEPKRMVYVTDRGKHDGGDAIYIDGQLALGMLNIWLADMRGLIDGREIKIDYFDTELATDEYPDQLDDLKIVRRRTAVEIAEEVAG